MHQATCTNCGRDVQITPDAEFCSACGENLKALIPIEKISQYFYDRVAHLAEAASTRAALEEVRRGLEQVATPELYLLGAILAESLGEYDLMRRYVSRIPVADRLRDEGEWLLRSHQVRQSAHRVGDRIGDGFQQNRSASIDQAFAVQRDRAEDDLLSDRITRRSGRFDETLVVGPTREIQHSIQPVNILEPNQGSRRLWPALLLSLLFVGMLWGGWRFLRGTPDTQQVNSGQDTSQDSDVVTGSTIDGAQQNGANTLEPQVTVASTAPPVDSAPVNPPAIDNNDTTIPSDLVRNENQASSVAGLEIGLGVSTPFDLSGYLLKQGRADLASFRLDSILEDNVLVISGSVNTSEERSDVIALAETTSDLVTVSALELLVRQPDTYTIEAGDTLWLIGDKLYGDGERWNEIYEANRDVLSSPDAIVIGQILKIPQDR